MIGFVRGILAEKGNGYIIVDVNGIGQLEDGDKGKDLFPVNNRGSILVFDKRGNMSNIDVNDISSTPIDSGGIDLSSMINVAGEVLTAFPKPEDEIEGHETYLVLTTRKGLSKKMCYKNIQKEARSYISW